MPYLNVLQQNGAVLHDCNKDATFQKCMLHREPETEKERERVGEKEIQSETLFGSLSLLLAWLTRPLLDSERRYLVRFPASLAFGSESGLHYP